MLTGTGDVIQGGTLNIGSGCTMAPIRGENGEFHGLGGACSHCYAMAVTAGLDKKFKGMAAQLRQAGKEDRAQQLEQMYDGTTKTVNGIEVWTGKVIPHPHRIAEFLRKTAVKPWFVSSCTDFWHDGYSDEYLAEWWAAFAVNPNQRILLLTKRPGRQRERLSDPSWINLVKEKAQGHLTANPHAKHLSMPDEWPLPNVWTGASAGQHEALVHVLKDLLYTPSACQWLSLEPLYADVKLGEAMAEYSPEDRSKLKWAIFGGESGPRSRPMDLEWVRTGLKACRDLGISPFVKQKGEVLAKALNCVDKKGGDITEWPEDVRVREYPGDTASS